MSFALALLLLAPLCTGIGAAEEEADVTVLFTHDTHSHMLPSKEVDGGEFGGFARLAYAINEQREKYPNAILVDGGDFSMGSLFQTAYTSEAFELRTMGAIGYDAVTLGNHEFDYRADGIASMLNSAVNSGDRLPPIVSANHVPYGEDEAGYNEKLTRAFESYGVEDYIIIERGGTYFAIFGLFGEDAHICAPNAGLKYLDPVETAQKTVDAARAECLEKYNAEPVVIALSHCGTKKREGEDYNIAKNTSGIHLIVSAHTHTTIEEPILVDGTIIVSANEYAKYLGVASFNVNADGTAELKKYRLIPIDGNMPEDRAIANRIDDYCDIIDRNYLSQFGYSIDSVLVNNDYMFETVKELKAGLHESTVCNLYSDAYRDAAYKATGKMPDVSFTAAGVIRGSLPIGDITVYDVFRASSLGVGNEGELVAVYITGADLKQVLEMDATMQPKMKSAQLYFSGVEYSINKKRARFNRVDYAAIRRDDDTVEPIEDDKLYYVVSGTFAFQLLDMIDAYSEGALSVVLRDENGDPIDKVFLFDHVIRDERGESLREWVAIAEYLESMGGKMDAKYASPDGRKVVYKSYLPWDLLRNPNKYTYASLFVFLLVSSVSVTAIVVGTKYIKKYAEKKKKEKAE